jgi:hypothetical protein
LTAAPSSYLLLASRSSSTINSSRTIPNTASSARRNVPGERNECAPRHAQPVRSAVRRRLFPSSRPKAGQCCAVRASRNSRRSRSLNRSLL